MAIKKTIASKVKILVFIFAFFNCFLLNFLNINYIQKTNPENKKINTQSLVENSTVWSIDNSWYLPQAWNLSHGNGFTIDSSEPEMSVRRTPIYPLFYTFHYILFGEQDSFKVIRYSQTFLFALSALLLMMSVFNFSNNRSWAIWTGLLYGINVFVISYCFFTLTESLSPFLVVLTIYFFSKYIKESQQKYLVYVGISLAVSFLCRPTVGVLFVGIFAFLFIKFYHKKIELLKFSLILLFTFLTCLLPWVIRNYHLTGEIIIAEKYYHGATMSFGRAHIKLREIVSVWTNPANLSTEVFSTKLKEYLKENNWSGLNQYIDNYLSQWPQFVFQSFSKEEVHNDLLLLADCFRIKEELKINNNKILRKVLLNQDCEFDVYNSLSIKKQALIKDNFFRYWIITPVKTSFELIFNSQLHNFKLLNALPGRYLILGKGFTYLYNVFLYIALLYFLLSKSIGWELKLFILAPILLLYTALTVFLFRYVENRYLLVINPLLFIPFSYAVNNIYQYLNKAFQNSQTKPFSKSSN